MTGSGKSGMIDGFRTVQAVRLRSERGAVRKPPDAKAPPERDEESRPESAVKEHKASIGRTALPTRHELVCYCCRYKFVVNGRLDKVFCPKCREQLETGDHDIEGAWTTDIMTVGKVHVKAGAKVDGVKIIATDIVVAGDCSSADLCPTRQIELDTGAVVAPATLNSSKIVILAGAQVSLSEPLRCNELDIYGALSAKASPGGLVQIHAGGMFRGDLECAHLIIFEGAGLSANLRVSPALAKDKAEHAENVAQNTAGNKKELLSDGEKEAEGKRIVKGAFKEESGKVE